MISSTKLSTYFSAKNYLQDLDTSILDSSEGEDDKSLHGDCSMASHPSTPGYDSPASPSPEILPPDSPQPITTATKPVASTSSSPDLSMKVQIFCQIRRKPTSANSVDQAQVIGMFKLAAADSFYTNRLFYDNAIQKARQFVLEAAPYAELLAAGIVVHLTLPKVSYVTSDLLQIEIGVPLIQAQLTITRSPRHFLVAGSDFRHARMTINFEMSLDFSGVQGAPAQPIPAIPAPVTPVVVPPKTSTRAVASRSNGITSAILTEIQKLYWPSSATRTHPMATMYAISEALDTYKSSLDSNRDSEEQTCRIIMADPSRFKSGPALRRQREPSPASSASVASKVTVPNKRRRQFQLSSSGKRSSKSRDPRSSKDLRKYLSSERKSIVSRSSRR